MVQNFGFDSFPVWSLVLFNTFYKKRSKVRKKLESGKEKNIFVSLFVSADLFRLDEFPRNALGDVERFSEMDFWEISRSTKSRLKMICRLKKIFHANSKD